MHGIRHINAYIEIVLYLLKRNSWTKTKDIQNYLEEKGILEKSSSSNRRLLGEYLKNLEYNGYIISKYEETKGRQSQEWKINPNYFKDIISLSNEEKISFFTAFNFMPDWYKTLPFFKSLHSLLTKISLKQEKKDFEKIAYKFKYVPEFHERFSEVRQEILDKLYEAVIEEYPVVISYQNKDKLKVIFPIGIFLYNGLLYLKSIDITDNNTYKILKVDCIKSVLKDQNITENLKNQLRIKAKIYQDTVFKFETEKPFFFAMDINKSILGCSKPEDFKFLDTQIDIKEIEKDKLRVYALGFTGWRFASRIIVPYVLKFYKPNKEIIDVAKKHKAELKKTHTDISFSLKENSKRYDSFLETYKKVLEERLQAI